MNAKRESGVQSRRPEEARRAERIDGPAREGAPLPPEQGVLQLQQTAGNRAVQRALVTPSAVPAVIQRHITPSAESALTSLDMSLALMIGSASMAGAQDEQLMRDAGTALDKAMVVQGGTNPPMPEGAGGEAGAPEEIQVPATAGM